MNNILRRTLVCISIIGVVISGGSAAASVSCSLPAILFGLAGLGFSAIYIYYIFVRGIE